MGSIREIVDYTGKVKQRYDYKSYGETKISKVNPKDKFIDSPYGYTSRELDIESGDMFYRARYYDSQAGRFISEDPIGFAGGDTNLYRYVKNSPIMYNDPSGLLRNPDDIFDEALNHPDSDSSGRGQWIAFQHCFASCMMAAENGGVASLLAGHAWETVNNIQGQSSSDFAMDVNNNAKGRKLGNSCPDRNRTSFNKNKSKKISKSCASSCSNANLMRLDF